MTFCTVHRCGDSLQCEWPYECSDFELGWITFCILCTCVVSLHWGWACVGLCDCRIVGFVWILSIVCFAVISHERLFLWKSCPGCTYGPWELKKIKQGQDDHLWVENWVYTLHWEHPWRRNDKGSLSEDVGRLIQWNYVLVWHILKSRWVKNCKYPVKKIYCISIILKLVQFKPWYGGVAPEIYVG